MSTAVTDLRGRMYRERRLMPPQETTEFLRRQKVANVGTIDTNGRPYVVPLVYIYEGGDLFVPSHGRSVWRTGNASCRALHCGPVLEVLAVWHTGTGDRLPGISDVLSWLTYLDSQCPECTQIE